MLWNKFNLFTFKSIWKFGIVDDGSIKLRPQLPVCFGFTIAAATVSL